MKAAFRVLVAGALISEIAVLVLVNTGVGLASWWALVPIGLVGVALSLLYGQRRFLRRPGDLGYPVKR